MFVTFFDTCMVSLAALIVWRINPIYVFFPWLTIACLDGLYLSSALTKVPDGAWFTLTLAGVLASLFILWRFGKEQQWQAEAEDRFPTTHLVTKGKDGKLRLTEAFGGDTISTIKGFGVFFDKAGETTPAVFTQFLSKLVAAPEVIVFFHLRPLETPSVAPEQRYTVSRLAIPHCYRVVVRHGYMDAVITPDLASLVCEQVRDFIIRGKQSPGPLAHPPPSADGEKNATEKMFISSGQADEDLDNAATTTQSPSSASDAGKISQEKEKEKADETILADVVKLQQAFDHKILYIIGKEEMRIKPGTKIWRNVLLRAFLWLRDNTRTKIAALGVPTDRIVEVGFVKEV
jgi:KUP system potassium uptake protein